MKINVKTFSYRHPLFLTSSPLLEIPPPTALLGLLASILGIGCNDVKENRKMIKKEIQDKLEKIEIYIPRNIKSKELGLMRFNVDVGKQKENWFTPVTYTYLIDYVFYIKLFFKNVELMEKVKESIIKKESKFTPYLGSSENLINEICIVDEKDLPKDFLFVKKLEDVEEIDKKRGLIRIKLPGRYNDDGEWEIEEYVILFP